MRKLGFVVFFLLGCLSVFGQVNPNTFTEETDPNNANFEFYSQKSDSTRRASFNNVRKGMVLSINHTRQTAPTDTTGLMTNLMSFYKTAGDTIYVQDGAGNAFLLYDPTLNLQSVTFSGDTLYVEDASPIDLSAINTDSQTIDSAWVSGDSIYLSVSGDGVAAFGFDVSGISGSGGASSGSNGVTVAAGVASLSVDTLSADVEYTTRGASSGNFQIKPYTNSNNIQFLSNESVITIGSNRAYYIFADTFLNEYIQANGTRTIYDLRTTTTGIEYADDYSADYSERSLVDRGYIDERIDSITTLVYVTDFGATGDDTTDDYAAFEAAINYVDTSAQHDKIYLHPGTYYINGRLQFTSLANDVHFEALGRATIVMDTVINPVFQLRGTEVDTFTLLYEAFRGDDTLYVTSTTGIDTSNWLFLESNQTVETGWGYEESDIHKVYKIIDDTTVVINTTLNFGYDPGSETVTVSSISPVNITFRNIDFKTTRYTASAGAQAFISVRNCRLVIDDCNFISSVQGQTIDHIVMGQTIGSRFNNVTFRGGRYGALINYSRDVRADKIEGEFLRHIFVPATFTDGLTVNGMVGYRNRSTIDAHPSFNIWYNDVRTEDTEFPNCRAWGIKLTNCNFGVADSTYTLTYAYFFMYAPQVNTAWLDYMTMYDAHFENVVWVHPNGGKFNGLVVPYCRNLTYINCRSHSLGSWDDGSLNTLIDNCQTAHIEHHGNGPNAEDSNLTITNTLFDGNLCPAVQTGATTDIVIRQFPEKPAIGIVSNCRFVNYNDTINYVTDQLYGSRDAKFYNCEMTGFKGFSKFVSNSNRPDAESFALVNCKVTEFTDSIDYYLTTSRVPTQGTYFYDIGGSTAYKHYQGDTLQNVVNTDVKTIRHERGNMPWVVIVDTSADTVVANTHYKVEYSNYHSVDIEFYADYASLVVMIKSFFWLLAWRRKDEEEWQQNQT